MKILFLAHRIPFPPDKGDKIRSYQTLKYLAARHEVHLVCLIDNPRDVQAAQELQRTLPRLVYEELKPFAQRLRMLKALWQNKPLTAAYFYLPRLQQQLDALVARERFDALFVYSSTMAEYVRRLKIPKRIMDFCDLDSQKFKQYAEVTAPPFSWLYRFEGNRLATYEREAARYFEHVLFINPEEQLLFEKNRGGKNTALMGNGVDWAYYNSPLEGGQGGVAQHEDAERFSRANNTPRTPLKGGIVRHTNDAVDSARYQQQSESQAPPPNYSPLEGGQGGVAQHDDAEKFSRANNTPRTPLKGGIVRHTNDAVDSARYQQQSESQAPPPNYSPLDGGQGGVAQHDDAEKFSRANNTPRTPLKGGIVRHTNDAVDSARYQQQSESQAPPPNYSPLEGGQGGVAQHDDAEKFSRANNTPRTPHKGGIMTGPYIAFTGAMDYLPNVDAAHWCAREIFPLVRASEPELEFYIIGGNPSRKIRKLHAPHNGIHVTGYLPDLRPLLKGARAFVAPMRIARGMQTKILEAMACGVPVVTSAQAANGIGARDNEEVLIADIAQDYARQTLRLLNNEEERVRLRQRALAFLRENFDWEKNLAVLEGLLQSYSPLEAGQGGVVVS